MQDVLGSMAVDLARYAAPFSPAPAGLTSHDQDAWRIIVTTKNLIQRRDEVEHLACSCALSVAHPYQPQPPPTGFPKGQRQNLRSTMI